MKVNVLAFDIETLPMIVSTFRLFKANIRQESIIEYTSVFCASWQMLDHMGRPKSGIESVSIMDKPGWKDNIYNDYHTIKTLRDALLSADVYLYQNGASFDLRIFNARAIYHGFDPIPQKNDIDTLKQARKHFRFDSNKLDYIGRFLSLGEKLDTGGMELWDNIVQYKYPPVGKNPDLGLAENSIKYAIKYNKQDVKLLIKVYNAMRSRITLPNFSLYLGKVTACIHCGGKDFVKLGFRYLKAGKYQRYHCNICHKHFDPPRTQGKYIDAEYS